MPPKRKQKKGASSQVPSQASKTASKVPSRQDTPAVPGTPAEPALPNHGTTVVGINFGQTASSIALINKEGRADCIANDDGDRQIATAISFAGDQIYIGNPAKLQLVRNNGNTILGFRNLVGKTYEEVKSIPALFNSAPVIDKDGQPAFSVSIAETQTVFTVAEIVCRYLTALLGYATDFIGRKIHACVMAIPDDFSQRQRDALRKIVENDVGLKLLQFVNETEAAAVVYSPTTSNIVCLDVGGNSAKVSVVAARRGMLVPLAKASDSECGGHQLDAALVEFFSKEFTKKTKIQLESTNHRAMMKLRLAAEVTKRSLSASQSAACSVESLADGVDFSGSLNRMRFDLLASRVYGKIVALVEEAVKQSGLSKESIDEIILIGGSTKLTSVGQRVAEALHPAAKILNTIEPDEAVALGCVLHARSVVRAHPLDLPEEVSKFEESLTSVTALESPCLSKPLGLVISAPEHEARAVDGKVFMVLTDAMTPLPFRAVFELAGDHGKGGNVVVDLWQGEHDVKVEQAPKRERNGAVDGGDEDVDDGDEEEEDEDEEMRTAIVRPVGVVAHLDVPDVQPRKLVTLTVSVDEHGSGRVCARGSGGQSDVAAEFAV